MHRTANQCFKDAADLHADLEQYPQAIARYEQVADHSLGSALSKYSVKEYWLRAGLCALAFVSSISRQNAQSTDAFPGPHYSSTQPNQILFSRHDLCIHPRGKIREFTHRGRRSR